LDGGLAGFAEGGVVGEVLQQQSHGCVGVLPPSQIRGAEVGEVDVLEAPAGRPGVEAACGGGEEVGEPAHRTLDGASLVAADQALGFAAPIRVVLVEPDQQFGIHPGHQLLGGPDRAVLHNRLRARRRRREATSL
jgi:hypothetical protein